MKFPIAVGAAAIGIALSAASIRTVQADTTIIPPNEVPCWKAMSHCSYYDSDAYWSGCSLDYGTGEIQTAIAEKICTDFHSS